MKLQIFRYGLSFLLIGSIALGLASCKKKTLETEESSTSAGTEEASTIDESNPDGSSNAALMRLSPEQISKTFQQTLGLGVSWDGGDGRIVDGLLSEYGVLLGGIDFQSAFVRDPSSKIHTLLAVRILAWQGAEHVVWQDLTKIDKGSALDELKLFPADFLAWSMVPGDSAENEKAWQTQLERIYWTLLARPPDEQEIALHRQTFLQQTAKENAGVAWITAVYVILAGAEFWNLWGHA